MAHEDLEIPHCHTWNPEGKETVLLIPGAFASHAEWEPVASKLPSQYRIVVPSLGSSDVEGLVHPNPLTVGSASDALADLLKRYAADSRAHVVGHSLRASFAIHLAGHYPDLVQSVFVSGYTRFAPTRLMPTLLSVGLGIQNLVERLPKSMVSAFLDDAELPESGPRQVSRTTTREVVSVLVTDKPIAPVPARTLVAAATKGGLIPSNDNVKTASWVLQAIRQDQGSTESRAVRIPLMRHGWNVIDPSFFARVLRAWMEQQDLPEGVLPV